MESRINTHVLKICTSLIIGLFPVFATAQNPLDIFNSEIDTNYIQTFPEALTLKAFTKTKLFTLNIEDHKNDYELIYKPNGHTTMGFGLNYKWLGFSLDFKIIDQNNTAKYGKTSYFDFQSRFYLRRGIIELAIQDYQGFYLENTAAMVADWPNSDAYILRPDMRVFSSGINYTHVFNPEKFSYISSFSQTEVQKKSAGSIIVGGAINYHLSRGDSSAVPLTLIYEDAFEGDLYTQLKGFTTNARFGYAHTFVALERFFLSLSMDAGLSYSLSRYRYQEAAKQKGNFNVNSNVSFKFAAGYNHNHWFAGITATRYYHLNSTSGQQNSIRLEYGYVNFVIVRRFMLKTTIWLPKI